jgi:hypothetical protein
MSDDPQDQAESLDEDTTGRDSPLSDEEFLDDAPDRPHGVQFADADVTDESFLQRTLQEEPEVSERDIDENDADL